jgi:hypothetical protein
MPEGTEGFDQAYEGENQHGDAVKLKATRELEAGQVVDLTADISSNYDYFKDGPGYGALEE